MRRPYVYWCKEPHVSIPWCCILCPAEKGENIWFEHLKATRWRRASVGRPWNGKRNSCSIIWISSKKRKCGEFRFQSIFPFWLFSPLASSTICRCWLTPKKLTDSERKQNAIASRAYLSSQNPLRLIVKWETGGLFRVLKWFNDKWDITSVSFSLSDPVAFTQWDATRHMSPLLPHYIYTTGLYANAKRAAHIGLFSYVF